MRICLMIEGQEGVSWEQWLALALAAEQAELDGLFRSDHYRSTRTRRSSRSCTPAAAGPCTRGPAC